MVNNASTTKAKNNSLDDINFNDILKCLEIVIRYILSKNESVGNGKIDILFDKYLVPELIYKHYFLVKRPFFELARAPPGSKYDII